MIIKSWKQKLCKKNQKKLNGLKMYTWPLLQELNLLTEIYPKYTSKRCKQIAEVFKAKGFHRSEIECRQKWINFLDPELNKNDWEDSELQKLYEIHDQVGSKWCVIQKYIGRTQNKIKNRFYGTLRNYIRFLISHLHRNSCSYNYEIGKLSPNFLNDIYKAENQFKFLNNQVKNSIFQMGFKVDRTFLAQRTDLKINLYQKLLTIVFKTFSTFKQGKARSFKKRKVEESEESEESVIESEESLSEKKVIIKQQAVEEEKQEQMQKIGGVVKEEAIQSPFSQPKIPEFNLMMPPQPFYPFWDYSYPNYQFWPQ